MSDRYMNSEACGIEPEVEGDEPTLEQWRDKCRALWAERSRLYLALEQCAAAFDSGPCTVFEGYARAAAELRRRMEIAGNAL